jgi:hypothetical protein
MAVVRKPPVRMKRRPPKPLMKLGVLRSSLARMVKGGAVAATVPVDGWIVSMDLMVGSFLADTVPMGRRPSAEELRLVLRAAMLLGASAEGKSAEDRAGHVVRSMSSRSEDSFVDAWGVQA